MRRILITALFTGAFIQAYSQLKPVEGFDAARKLAAYKTVRLTTDLSKLDENEKAALVYMIKAAQYADSIFWMQVYGDPKTLLDRIQDPLLRRYAEINYGPWDRLDDNKPFIQGIGPKPKGANFYPKDMRPGEYDSMQNQLKKDPYTVLHRGPIPQGNLPPPEMPPGMVEPLEAFPYMMAYQYYMSKIMESLLHASEKIGPTKDKELFNYLRQRGDAIMNSNFNQSDIEWLKMKNSKLDIIIGPIENYEDELYGKKTAFESFVLIRDKEWGAKLEKFIKLLPDLQKNLPVDSLYKAEKVSNSQSQLAVFDAVFYAGDANAGSKTIAVNLPNDETLQKEYGTRRSQLKNVMKAKFDNIVVPISQQIIDPTQRANVTWDAFFNDVMFHEVAHGLGIKNTVTNKGTVHDALGSNHDAIEECKADVLGLWMVTQMVKKGELKGKLDDYYVTFVTSVFRSVRFGASNAHGQANMITFNTLLENNAITRNSRGWYKVDVAKMRETIEKLAGNLLVYQGNGDAVAVQKFMDSKAVVGKQLGHDLDTINNAGIPKDLIFEQGLGVLGLHE